MSYLNNNLLAQAQPSAQPIMENLVESEQELQELNQRFVALVEEYQEINSSPEPSSFFNLENVYFWLVLLGLLLLAVGLALLLSELNHPENKMKRLVKTEEPKIREPIARPEEKQVVKKVKKVVKTAPKVNKKPGKAVKIKVVKVK